MKPEEQRIAIAKACGWRWVTICQQEGLCDDVRGYPPDVNYVGRNVRYVPDYLNDLNEMHGAVETLRGKNGPEWFDFQRLLMIECGSWMNCIQASAALRAEVFLKTLNLWNAGDFEV
jgi:hypothetical protein